MQTFVRAGIGMIIIFVLWCVIVLFTNFVSPGPRYRTHEIEVNVTSFKKVGSRLLFCSAGHGILFDQRTVGTVAHGLPSHGKCFSPVGEASSYVLITQDIEMVITFMPGVHLVYPQKVYRLASPIFVDQGLDFAVLKVFDSFPPDFQYAKETIPFNKRFGFKLPLVATTLVSNKTEEETAGKEAFLPPLPGSRFEQRTSGSVITNVDQKSFAEKFSDTLFQHRLIWVRISDVPYDYVRGLSGSPISSRGERGRILLGIVQRGVAGIDLPHSESATDTYVLGLPGSRLFEIVKSVEARQKVVRE